MNIKDIILDGLDLRNNGYWFVITGLFDFDKSIVTNDISIDGQSYNSSKINGKAPVLSGFITSNDINKKLALNRVLASNKLKELVISTEELGDLICNVEVKNRAVGQSPIAISAQLTMPDPYLYSADADSISLGAVSNVGLTFPFTFPIVFGTITGGEGTINNKGNAAAYPVITVVGTCDTITIENQTTGESMSLDVSLQESDTLVIDNREDTRGIYLNGNKRMDLKNGEWISCIPGDNVFSFQRNSLQTKQHCTISLQSRWI